ncbi:hypothetical protein FB45DRAFT_1026600 [Roridomyces roridus]|uniref:Uncharacterized protein n=1 Tax=Roridomyces roridus TaxID=1738132 RepID=A0AAD7BW37_9AGAR|nr:hypothetical protein FB45DRAFT_1026600 [Roridomyces roridus]
MPIIHPRRLRVPQSMLSLDSQVVLVHALTLHRSRGPSLRQSRFVESFMHRKEAKVPARRDITARIQSLRKTARHLIPNSTRLASVSPRVTSSSISERRSGRTMPALSSLQNFLITPSKFSSPFTPANQVLHTPFEPPKATPTKRSRNWQCSPAFQSRGPMSPTTEVVDENTSPESPICNLTKRLARIAPFTATPAATHAPRRLSYSRGFGASPWTPDARRYTGGQALASPVLIRSTLWASPTSPGASPRHQLDELQFSPFFVSGF